MLLIANALSAAKPELGASLNAWREQMAALLLDPALETLEGEERLEALSLELRRTWIATAHALVNHQLKSPPAHQTVALPLGGNLRYVYERIL
ncbi:MAG: hypothetical protein HQM00_06480, partial [Magnetococcales bacterium]|nr:hypothetical protein [Magnetococcales bacterium]